MAKQAGRWATFIVRMYVPSEATLEEARRYILGWIQDGRGALEPLDAEEGTQGDPMWYLDPDKVTVAKAQMKRRA